MASSGHLFLSHAVVLLLCAALGTAVLPSIHEIISTHHRWLLLTGNDQYRNAARAEAACRIAVAMWNTLHAKKAIALSQILGVWEVADNNVSGIRVLVDVLVVNMDIGTGVKVATATADMYFGIMHNQLLIYETVRRSGAFKALPLHYHNQA